MPLEQVCMLKGRSAQEFETRCGRTVKVKPGLTMRQHGITGWEEQVRCLDCKRK